MTRSVDEINITNWTDTGLTTPIPRYQFNVEVKWTDDDGTPHTYGPQTHVFPNAIADMPQDARRRWAESVIMFAVRVQLGLNTWDQYSG